MSEEEKKAIKYLNGIIEINNIKIKNIEEKGDVSLTGLGTMHDVYKLQNLNYILVLNLIEKQDKEIENWKKIAEKLADKILEMDVDGEVFDFFCKYIPMEKCDEFSDGYCDKCIIDWARKEVEK